MVVVVAAQQNLGPLQVARGGGQAFTEEQAAINDVNEEGGCIELDSLTICSSEVGGTATAITDDAGFSGSPRLTIQPTSNSSHNCTEDLVQGTCSFTIVR